MNKSVKGALALGAAGAVLLSGYGTLALWNDSTSLNGGKVSSGQLALANPTTGSWKDVSGGGSKAISDITTFKTVPGDTLTYSSSATIVAKGNNLSATLKADPTSISGDTDLTKDVTMTTDVKVNGTTASSITSANDGQTVAVTVTLVFKKDSANASQIKQLDLANLKLALDQTRA